MEATTCLHKEHISNVESGVDEGVCSVCGQIRLYEWREGKGKQPKRITKVVKLGRVNGMVIIPNSKDLVELSPEEAAELRAATPAHNAENPEADDDHLPPVPPPANKKKERLDAARKLRGNKCQTCQYNYEHDEQHWCSQKRCPSRLPVKMRLVYRPLPTNRQTANDDRSHLFRETRGEAKPAQSKDRSLPPFPDFNDSWSFPVQEKWLASYVELRRLELAGK